MSRGLETIVQERAFLQWFFQMRSPTFWLSFHAPYACRHSGACCSSGWDIGIETVRVPAVSRALAEGRLQAPVEWHRAVAGAPDEVAGTLVTERGHCVFHQAPGCAIHGSLGHTALPSACQHFPRIALLDSRGVFVTLSHYCPTAASLLFDESGPVAIVEGPPALPNGDVPEGLDARAALPPLETPRRLMGWGDYAAWEGRAVNLLMTASSPQSALDMLDPRAPVPSDDTLLDRLRDAVPPPYSWTPFPASVPVDGECSVVVARYLAAHAFASWTAYQGNGLRCTVLYLRLVLAVLKSELGRGHSLREAIRQADLVLRHLADRQLLADALSDIAAR
jgi:hypothetical protein